nr:galactokinase [Bacillus sp. HMF5848]
MKALKNEFVNVFGGSINDVSSYFAPGRVNLIGEHIDYNGGHVFPCALSVGTYAIARKRNDNILRLYSKNFTEMNVIETSIKDLSYDKRHDWSNYPKGVIYMLQQEGYSITSGFDVLFFGNIPNGAGLSSSASIEVVTAVLLKDLFSLQIGMIDMVKLSQRAENEFIGVNCGIMDQFAIGMGKQDQAILLDCDTLDYQYSPIKLNNMSLVIANTNKKRGLADSKYNERRNECERALSQLQQELSIASLCQLTPAQFDQSKHLISNEVDRRRAKHAVYENERTMQAVKKLQNGDIAAFGQLMNQSHISLRDDYEVSGFELDTMVEAAWKQDGVIGARMTGAGFGGCAVCIVENNKIESFIANVSKEYTLKTKLEADFYVVEVGEGARKLEEVLL